MNFPHLIEVMIVHEGLNHFRHTAHIVVLLQQIRIILLEHGSHIKIALVQQFHISFFPHSHEKLGERKGIEIKKLYFSNWERGPLMQCHAQKAPSTDDLILRSVLVEIFEAGQCSRYFLYLVKNQKGILRVDFMPCIEL